MARGRATPRTRRAEDYRHGEAQRLNNPPAGLARYETEKSPTRTFSYDPHLSPQLMWAGKAERTSFEVDAVSIHVHEAVSAAAIIRTLRKEQPQLDLFADPQLDRSREVEFYQHEVGWRNRLIIGDSLIVMASLLDRERMGGRIQCIYVDPPYGINYNSNFQARISDRTPKESADDTVTRDPEQIQAYRDTWTLGVHSYLSYLRDRLLVARELLASSGSIFVQIGPDRLHLVRTLLDEIFRPENCMATITVQKTSQVTSRFLPEVADFLLWYARDKAQTTYFQLFDDRTETIAGQGQYTHVEIDAIRRPMTHTERADPSVLGKNARVFSYDNATSQGFSPTKTVDFTFEGKTFHPGPNRHWLLRKEGMEGLASAGRLAIRGRTLMYVRYAEDSGLVRRTNIWTDTGSSFLRNKRYVVETNPKVIERCILMTTQPGDLVLDPTCGSGTTAYVAERQGRRWITCDTSRVALALARERLLTATFPYYRLADPIRGVDAGLMYETKPWVKASAVGYGDGEIEETTLYDAPEIDPSKVRVSGPFTLEALSRYSVNPLEPGIPRDPGEGNPEADHVNALLDALRARGIPVRGRPPLKIASLTRLSGTGALHAEGTAEDGQSFAVSIGPRYGPITIPQVDDAIAEAAGFQLVVFAGFTATAEAQAFLARGRIGRYAVVLLEANADLLVRDLLKNTTASQTFHLFAAPDVQARTASLEKGLLEVELRGVDVFDVTVGEARQHPISDVAAWFLDHDYDGEVFHICQAFFPKSQGWEALGRSLKGVLDQEVLARTATFVSNPFAVGEHKKSAVRVIADSGQTSEATIDLAAFVSELPHA